MILKDFMKILLNKILENPELLNFEVVRESNNNYYNADNVICVGDFDEDNNTLAFHNDNCDTNNNSNAVCIN